MTQKIPKSDRWGRVSPCQFRVNIANAKNCKIAYCCTLVGTRCYRPLKREYAGAIEFLCSYTSAGRNKHDDVPDAMAMLADYIDSLAVGKVEIFPKPF